MNKRHVLATLLAAALLPLSAGAADFPIPNKPIKLVVGFPAGGGTDIQARVVGQHLSTVLGVPVIVENRPGASTMIAALEVAKAAPDGHTILYTASSAIAQLPHTIANIKYDSFKDFTPISMGALGPLVLVIHKSIPASNVKELVAWAKANPGKINYVSQGVGTSAHVYGELLAKQTGIEMVHVPYKGANDVAKDFVSGLVHLQFASSSGATALAKSGNVKLLAVVATKRSELFPELPTLAEASVPGVDIESWLGWLGPAGMAPATVTRLNQAFNTVLAMPKVREEFRRGGAEALGSTPERFTAVIRETYEQWGRVAQQLNFRKE